MDGRRRGIGGGEKTKIKCLRENTKKLQRANACLQRIKVVASESDKLGLWEFGEWEKDG